MAYRHVTKVLTKVDTVNGFFQLKSGKHSQKLTTFNTPFV